jgi:hypothetical protein
LVQKANTLQKENTQLKKKVSKKYQMIGNSEALSKFKI